MVIFLCFFWVNIMHEFLVYTDGSSSPKMDHGCGGWAYIAFFNDEKIYRMGGIPNTTNQVMEMQAIAEALHDIAAISQDIDGPVSVTVISDSRYCIDGATDWIHGWKKRGWKRSDGPLKNKELWQRIYSLVYESGLAVTFKWVKGHSGDKYNEEVDVLAGKAKQEVIKRLRI